MPGNIAQFSEYIPRAIIVTAVFISVIVIAAVLGRFFARKSPAPSEDSELEAATGWHKIRQALHFLLGPLPLSIALHVLVLLLLIIFVKQQERPELLTVDLEAGGGGGGGADELQEIETPDVPLPDTKITTQRLNIPVPTGPAVEIATNYTRSLQSGGVGVGRGGGIGSGYGRGVGAGFGGFIGQLRRTGLDVVIVIDGTGSMRLIIQDVKERMAQLVQAIHRLVPIARVGLVVYGGKHDPVEVRKLTLSPRKLTEFLDNIKAKGGDQWEEDMRAALEAAINQMNYRKRAKKVIVLVGDSPPRKEDFQPVLALIREFRSRNGTFNTVDVTQLEHERFERDYYRSTHNGQDPPSISPLPGFYQQTRAAYKVMAKVGGGAMRTLNLKSHVGQQVLMLAFGEKWRQQIAVFGKSLGNQK